MSERLTAIIFGRVQMVMYRDFARRTARGLGLVGEVKNLSDGTVAVVAEGPRAALERFVKRLQRGPLFARVEKVEASFTGARGAYRTFEIVYA